MDESGWGKMGGKGSNEEDISAARSGEVIQVLISEVLKWERYREQTKKEGERDRPNRSRIRPHMSPRVTKALGTMQYKVQKTKYEGGKKLILSRTKSSDRGPPQEWTDH